MTEDEKKPVTEQLEKLKEALKGDNIETIKAEAEELTKRFYAIAEKLYQDAAPQGESAPEQGEPAGQGPDGAVYDADYKVVDEDDQNK